MSYNSSTGYSSGSNYVIMGYAGGYSKSMYSPKKVTMGCTCFGQGCKGTCRM